MLFLKKQLEVILPIWQIQTPYHSVNSDHNWNQNTLYTATVSQWFTVPIVLSLQYYTLSQSKWQKFECVYLPNGSTDSCDILQSLSRCMRKCVRRLLGDSATSPARYGALKWKANKWHAHNGEKSVNQTL